MNMYSKLLIFILCIPSLFLTENTQAQAGVAHRIQDNTVVLEKPAAQHPRDKGAIAGTVLDEKGEPVIGAVAVVLGLPSVGTTTDADGKYVLSGVPAKTVSVQISLMTYETLLVEGVTVAAGKTTLLNVTLKESTQQLSEVVVTASYREASAAGLYAVQKLSASMTDGLSADLIRRTSDNNVGQVLKRVAGVTVQDNKFVTVRGMSERYNNVQLNGSSLPSTEPNRRNFSFDIIPSSLIESVVVNKTFTPDLPGEFTGGLVQVKTLSVPDEKFFALSAGSGANTISTGRELQTNRRFDADYFLGEIDHRTWYAGHTAEQIPQSETNAAHLNHFGFYKYKAAPLQNHSLSFGLPLKIKGRHKLGMVGAVTYRHEETREDINEVNTFGRDTLVRNLSDQFNKQYKFVTAIGAVANFGWETANHAITWRNLFNNRFTHTTLNRVIWKEYDNLVQPEIYSSPLQAQLVQTQLDGEHSFFKRRLKLTWNADYNQTSRINPDDRFAQALSLGGDPGDTYLFNWLYSLGPSRPFISSHFVMYSRLDETKKNAGANAEYSFLLLDFEQKLKAGFHRSERSADYIQTYLHGFINSTGVDGTSLHQLFDPANFDSGFLYYKTQSFYNRTIDYYEGNQTIDAFYLMGEITPLKPLRIIGGIRLEDAETKVTTRVSWYDTENKYHSGDSLLTRSEKEWLPSVTAIYSITPNLNFRASYSESLARPDFRELSYVSYYNVTDRLEVINQKPLETSSSRNCDLRLEWYPARGEVVSLSAFYKDFDKPVEKVTRVKADFHNFELHTINLDRAIMRGLELNFRKSFGFIAPPLKNLWLSGNFALIEGNIESEAMWGGNIKARNRPLQGLAPYNANAALTYEGARFGAAVNYTRVGRTLIYGGDYNYSDQYEAPRNVLDLQLYARFFKQRLEVKLNAGDVLNEDIIIYQNMGYADVGGVEIIKTERGMSYDNTALGMDYNKGDYLMSRISRGINLSLAVTYKF
jgi:outer membrane receptor protein involved in Fe transport